MQAFACRLEFAAAIAVPRSAGPTERRISSRLGHIFKIRYDLYQWKFMVKFLNNFLAQYVPEDEPAAAPDPAHRINWSAIGPIQDATGCRRASSRRDHPDRPRPADGPVRPGRTFTRPTRRNGAAPMTITITAFEKSPDGGKGLARDTRVRWALEEAGLPYEVRQGDVLLLPTGPGTWRVVRQREWAGQDAWRQVAD